MPEMPDTSQILEFARSHLALTLLSVGLIFALLMLAILPKPHSGARIVEALPSDGFEVVCFPVKVHRASAGWTRAVAILPN